MYTSHKMCSQPSNKDIKVWRYMDITKLLAILEYKQLFFPSIKSLEDPLEGFLNKATVSHMKKMLSNLGTAQNAQRQNGIKQYLQGIKDARTFLNVSSWHMNKDQSAAMWQLYSGNGYGLVVQSTYQRLRDSFVNEEKDVMIGVVKYVDEENDIIDPSNAINFAVHKRKGFEHEKELRAIILSPNRNNGAVATVDPEVLIEKIYTSPDSDKWVFELIQKIIKKYNVDISIERSEMYKCYY